MVANVRGRKYEVYFSADYSLWRWVTARDVLREGLMRSPGQLIVASEIEDVVAWIRSYVLPSLNRDRALEMLGWRDYRLFLQLKKEREKYGSYL